MPDPEYIDITSGQKYKAPESIKHFRVEVPRKMHLPTLCCILKEQQPERCIVFLRTKGNLSEPNATWVKMEGLTSFPSTGRVVYPGIPGGTCFSFNFISPRANKANERTYPRCEDVGYLIALHQFRSKSGMCPTDSVNSCLSRNNWYSFVRHTGQARERHEPFQEWDLQCVMREYLRRINYVTVFLPFPDFSSSFQATDVAARGLDIPEVDLILQGWSSGLKSLAAYPSPKTKRKIFPFAVEPPPNGADYYLHRSGRTGRAGRPGTAIMIHSSTRQEQAIIREIEDVVPLEQRPVPPGCEDMLMELRNASSRNLIAYEMANPYPEKKPFKKSNYSSRGTFSYSRQPRKWAYFEFYLFSNQEVC